jgi:hypothetical protein
LSISSDTNESEEALMSLSAHVVVINNGEILLVQRNDFKVWVLPGGQVEAGESVAQNELDVETRPGQTHHYDISYAKAGDEVRFFVDDQDAGTYTEVPSKIDSLIIALGLMTEKTIEQGKSVSVHGQGLIGE